LGARRSIVAAVVVAGWLATGCAGSSESGVTGAGGNPDASATGVAGRGGGSGAAGTTGAAGRGGTTGAAGTSGAAGTTGAAGRGGATGTAGTTGAAGTAGASALPDLGKACAANTGGTTCLTAASKIIVGAEGPANGYCSKACTADADCSSGGICLDVSAAGAPAQGYCFQTCTFGGAAGSSKCHGRTDVGC
jgi:pilus assembly protein FimV